VKVTDVRPVAIRRGPALKGAVVDASANYRPLLGFITSELGCDADGVPEFDGGPCFLKAQGSKLIVDHRPSPVWC